MDVLSVTADGVLQWTLQCCNMVALQQLQNNVIGAAQCPAPDQTMFRVCRTLEAAWDLHVLCPCRDENPAAICHGACMRTSVRCMGVTVYVFPLAVFCQSHQNALDAHGQLTFSAPLQSFWASNTRQTRKLLLPALPDALPLLYSRGAFLLSCTMWMQLVVLSGSYV